MHNTLKHFKLAKFMISSSWYVPLDLRYNFHTNAFDVESGSYQIQIHREEWIINCELTLSKIKVPHLDKELFFYKKESKLVDTIRKRSEFYGTYKGIVLYKIE